MFDLEEADYAVIGSPISHSLSPIIHQDFSDQTHKSLSYKKIEVTSNTLADFIKKVKRENLHGFNITSPLKESVIPHLDRLHPSAKCAGAVNTVVNGDGELVGYNTDGLGLVRDLEENHDILISKQKILVIGAGGAARGLVAALIERDNEVSIINRTQQNADALLYHFNSDKVSHASEREVFYDIVINTVKNREYANGVCDKIKLSSGACYYDINYQYELDVNRLKGNGFEKILTGEGMLVMQALEAFKIWHGDHDIDVEPVLKSIR